MRTTHNGVITRLDGDTATLRLLNDTEGCRGCAMSLLCHKAQEVTARVPAGSVYCEGDRVALTAKGATRTAAIAMLLVAPLALLVCGLALGTAAGWGDAASGLSGLAGCALWYAMLPLMAKRLKARPRFEIAQKID